MTSRFVRMTPENDATEYFRSDTFQSIDGKTGVVSGRTHIIVTLLIEVPPALIVNTASAGAPPVATRFYLASGMRPVDPI